MEEGIISKSRPIVRNVALDDNDSDFGCCDRSGGNSVHVDVDKEIAESNKLTLALLPIRSKEDEINNNVETRDTDGNTNLRGSNRIYKPPERLSSVYHISNIKKTFTFSTGPIRKETPKARLMTTEEIESDYDPKENGGHNENQ